MNTNPAQSLGSRVRNNPLPLLDRHHRIHKSMRISVTDVCNIRCQYCMPDGKVQFLPAERLMPFSHLATVVRVAAKLGIEKYRITGGEPLTRPDLHQLFELISTIDGVRDLALTTNGMLLEQQVGKLVAAGLRRVNISLDTLSEATFQKLSRRSGLHRVFEGIEAAIAQPNLQVRLNALVLRDVNLDDVVELVRFAGGRSITMRFIEFMPLDADRRWNQGRMVSGSELRELLSSKLGPMQPIETSNPSQPSTDYQLADGTIVGFIDSVTSPFCSRCDRLRLTCDGKLRNCLFGKQEWDARQILDRHAACTANHNTSRSSYYSQPNKACENPQGTGRAHDSDELDEVEIELEKLLRDCVQAKAAAHGIDTPQFAPPERAMFQIGG